MPLKLLSPRKTGRKYYYVRGVLCGKRYFLSSGESNREEADKFREALEKRVKEQHEGKSSRMTFAAAAEKYKEFRNPGQYDKDWIDRISIRIGHGYVDEITHNDLVMIANDLYGLNRNASPIKNRSVMTPAGNVLHYAAKNKWCQWLKIEKFRENAPKTRYVTPEVEMALHAALHAKGVRWATNKRLLLLWAFRQGDRLSDMLRFRYEDCDLDRMVVSRHISKSDKYDEAPLDPLIARFLRRQPVREGFIFKWRDHHAANRWCKRLTDRMGVKFTFHMARHTVGKRLNDNGSGLKTIMQKLGQRDPKSAIRYQTTDIEVIRQASLVLQISRKSGAVFGSLGGKDAVK